MKVTYVGQNIIVNLDAGDVFLGEEHDKPTRIVKFQLASGFPAVIHRHFQQILCIYTSRGSNIGWNVGANGLVYTLLSNRKYLHFNSLEELNAHIRELDFATAAHPE